MMGRSDVDVSFGVLFIIVYNMFGFDVLVIEF